VLQLLQEAVEENGPPEFIRSDNGPELIARAIQDWLAENKIKTIYIDPGCPWQNGYAESFNSRFRNVPRSVATTKQSAHASIENSSTP
jgi:transposase InsO family protein